MDLVLRAIRNKLANDATLTAMVPANDITTGYNEENANYPCVLLGIKGDSEGYQISGIGRATISIDIYSNVGKRQIWDIYNRIKAIIHNNEVGITDSYRIIHSIYETTVDEDKYDRTHRVWRIVAKYKVLYGLSGLSVITGASGVIYADRDNVSADPSMEVAKFSGEVEFSVSFDYEFRISQERYWRAIHYKSGMAKLVISEVIFKPSILGLLWNVNINSGGFLNDASTSATTYQVNQNTYPSYLQVLFRMAKTDDGKKLEIESSKAVCNNLMVPFSKKDFSIFNCEWILLGDSNDNVAKVSIEN